MSLSRSSARVVVLVTAHEDSPRLYDCLRSLQPQLAEVGAEIMLVINQKPESFPQRAVDLASKLCSRILFVETPGKSNALNAGVAACDASVIAFSDDDAEPQPGWLSALTAPLLDERRPASLVGTGGRVLPIYPDAGVPTWYRAMVEGKPASVLGPRHDLGDAPFLYGTGAGRGLNPIGANCAYRREVFADYHYAVELGPNYQTGVRGGEDTELAHRLMRDGWSLQYVPDAVVHHAVREERLSLEYCAPRFYSHGVELARLRAMLGEPQKSRFRLRWERRLLLALYALCPFGLGWSPARIALQREKLRGMLAERARTEAQIDSRTDSRTGSQTD